MLRPHHLSSRRQHAVTSPRLCDSPGARRVLDATPHATPHPNSSQPAPRPPPGRIQHVWICRGALLPWSLQPALAQAHAAGGVVVFTLRTRPGGQPSTYTVDFARAPYDMVDEHGRTLGMLEMGPACRLPSPLPPLAGTHEPPAHVLTEWPLLSMDDVAGQHAALHAPSNPPPAVLSPTRRKGADFRGVIEEYRFGLHGEDDFELHGHDNNAPPTHASLAVDASANRVEMLQALLSKDRRVCLRSMGSLWAPTSAPIRGGLGEMHKGVALHRLDPRGSEFGLIEAHFQSTAPVDTLSVAGILRIQNKGAAKLFAAVRSKIWGGRSVKRDVTWEELLWHGVSRYSDLEPLLSSTFRPYYSARQESLNAYGCGCYFSMSSALADQYACEAWSVEDAGPVRVMVLAHVVLGDATLGAPKLMPPLKDGSRAFDSFVDAEHRPKLCVTTMDGQALQLYVVLYRKQWPDDGAALVSAVPHMPPSSGWVAPPAGPTPPSNLFAPPAPPSHSFSFGAPPSAFARPSPPPRAFSFGAPPSTLPSPSPYNYSFITPATATPAFGQSTTTSFGGLAFGSQAALGGPSYPQQYPQHVQHTLFGFGTQPQASHAAPTFGPVTSGFFGASLGGTLTHSQGQSFGHVTGFGQPSTQSQSHGQAPVFGQPSSQSQGQAFGGFGFGSSVASWPVQPAPAPLPPTTGTYTPAHHDASGSNGETSASHVAALSSPTRVPSSQGPTHPHQQQQHFAFPPAGEGDFENDPDL